MRPAEHTPGHVREGRMTALGHTAGAGACCWPLTYVLKFTPQSL